MLLAPLPAPCSVAILSALSASTIPFADEAYASIDALELPAGWRLEWLINHDGDSDPIRPPWLSDPRVRYAHHPRRQGAAAMRNLGLVGARSHLVMSLDPDDLLEPRALMTLGAAFADPRVAWSAGRWDLLQPDGTTELWRRPLYTGPRPQGWLSDEISRLGQTPFAMNSILYRRDALLAVGGWPAHPFFEDTILAVCVSNLAPGWASEDLVGLYRRHPTSTSAQPEFAAAKAVMYPFLAEVGGALGRLRGDPAA